MGMLINARECEGSQLLTRCSGSRMSNAQYVRDLDCTVILDLHESVRNLEIVHRVEDHTRFSQDFMDLY